MMKPIQNLPHIVSRALLLLAVLAGCSQSAAAQALWQIGQKDNSPAEFALAPDKSSQYGQDGFYIVGQSKPGVDWPYIQPGPADAWAGSRTHAAEIEFALAHTTAQGICRLSLFLADTQSPIPPRLQITVNGQSWTRDTTPGIADDSLNGKPGHGVPSVVTVDFPASLLQSGVNFVDISTVGGSWMIYDAVTMTAPAGVTLGDAPPIIHLNSAEWLHDVLTRTDDQLQQVLRLQASNFGPARDVVLRVSGEPDRTVSLPSGRAALEESFPESQSAGHSQVQLLGSGRPLTSAVSADREPCRHYTIYCINHSHMDIGYAYLQPKTLALHQQYLEEGLKANAQASNLPSDDQFRWNIESLFEVDDWLQKASPDQIALFQKEVQNGGLGLSGLYCNELTGLCRPEELAALLACADRLRTRYHIPIDSAMISDVPGYTWGLVPMLAQSGIKYFSWGPNPNDHLGFARDFDNKAFYWLSPSGKERVLVWQSTNGYQSQFDDNENSLVGFLKNFDQRFPNDPYDMLYDRHTVGDNGPADGGLPAFLHDWNSRYAYPHLVMATTSQMFHDFEARYGKTLPTVRGDYTGYWEDGAASTAVETALNRNAADALAQDEVLWSLLSPSAYPQGRFDNAWKSAVLYDEHTWGADQSWNNPESEFTKSQWAWKQQYALEAARQAAALQSDALKAVTARADSRTVAVFNTCSWPRTDLVILPPAQSRIGDAVSDALGRPVESQRLSDGSLAFLAGGVPALSSCKFILRPGRSRSRGTASAAAGLLQTARMSLRFDPQTGAITHWKVGGIGQDLVNAADPTCRGLNDYLDILGGDNSKAQYPSNVTLTLVDRGPLVASIRVDSAAPGTNSLSRLVQVIDALNQVRITDTFDKTQVHDEEAVDFGFNFDVPGSTVRMDMPWSVVRPDVDQAVNANKSVYPVDRWADVSNSAFGVTCANLDAPMMQIGEITLPRENAGGWLRTAKAGSTLYWSVMNNYWHTNYKAYQPGVATFRYRLQAHAQFDQAAAQRFGIGQSQPLLFAPVRAGEPDARLPLSLSNSAVLVTACHPQADGHGWLVRLFNGSAQPQSVTVVWQGAKTLHLARTDLWGNGGKPVAPRLSLAPMQVETLRVVPK